VERIAKAGAAYFGWVFGAGFLLGVLRQLFMVPRYGERIAELLEMPIMAVVIVIAARHVVRRMHLAPTVRSRLGMGAVGLGLMLLAEWAVVLSIRHQTLADYIATRDPVAGLAYLMMLAVYLLMPLWVRRRGPAAT
jgi:hypothetical protein